MRKLKASHTPLFRAWPAAHKLSLPGTQGKEREEAKLQPAAMNHSLPVPPPQGARVPPSGKGIMSACLRCLLSQKKPSWGGGAPVAKAAATKKKRRAAPSKTEEQGFLLSSWMGKHACKCSAQTPLKNLKLVICLNCRKFWRKAQAQNLI